MPPIDRVTAGEILMMAVNLGDLKGNIRTEAYAVMDFSYKHIPGYKQAEIREKHVDAQIDLQRKYDAQYGKRHVDEEKMEIVQPGFDKMVDDCLIVTKNESKEWRIEVLYWCRKGANADWEFESALGNISKTEMDLLQRFHKELDVSWEEIPQQL